jgi:hypothetical protein
MSGIGNFVYEDLLDDGVAVEDRSMVKLENGAVYIGEWDVQTNQRHGRGTMIFDDGAIFEGTWRQGAAFGQGRHIHADGDYYEGSYLNDMVCGIGTLHHNDGTRYEGEWRHDK